MPRRHLGAYRVVNLQEAGSPELYDGQFVLHGHPFLDGGAYLGIFRRALRGLGEYLHVSSKIQCPVLQGVSQCGHPVNHHGIAFRLSEQSKDLSVSYFAENDDLPSVRLDPCGET